MKNKFDFEEINLLPKLCVVKSRSECDTSITFGGNKFKLPVVPANMQSVIDEALAIKLAQSGYFYILHRFVYSRHGNKGYVRGNGRSSSEC